MRHEEKMTGTVATVALEGNVTIAHAAELKELLARVVSEATEVVVDMEKITQLDLSGIQLFCSACLSAEGGGEHEGVEYTYECSSDASFGIYKVAFRLCE